MLAPELFGDLSTCGATCTANVLSGDCSPVDASVRCERCDPAGTCTAANCLHPPED